MNRSGPAAQADHGRSVAAAAVAEEWSLRDAALIADASGRITYCSAMAAALLGHPPEALVGHALVAVIPGLPLAAVTPGDAPADPGSPSADAPWKRRVALAPGGRQRPVEVAVANTRVGAQRYTILTLRAAVSSPGSGP